MKLEQKVLLQILRRFLHERIYLSAMGILEMFKSSHVISYLHIFKSLERRLVFLENIFETGRRDDDGSSYLR